MTTGVIIFLILVVAVFIAIILNRHKHHLEFTDESLKAQVNRIFMDKRQSHIDRQDFLYTLKHALSCTQKEANVLLGRARKLRLVDVEDNMVILHPGVETEQ